MVVVEKRVFFIRPNKMDKFVFFIDITHQLMNTRVIIFFDKISIEEFVIRNLQNYPPSSIFTNFGNYEYLANHTLLGHDITSYKFTCTYLSDSVIVNVHSDDEAVSSGPGQA